MVVDYPTRRSGSGTEGKLLRAKLIWFALRRIMKDRLGIRNAVPGCEISHRVISQQVLSRLTDE